MDLNHLHLHVADLTAARAFYEQHFGFREKWRDGDILFLTNDAGFDLALLAADDREPMPAWWHFGFRLDSDMAVEAMHARLAPLGCVTSPLEREEGGFVTFRVRDADGYQIEVYWE